MTEAGTAGHADGRVRSGTSRSFITGHVDPADEPPWAMQIVVRMERLAPSSRTRLCEAAGVAVVRLMDDPRSAPGGEWALSFERWLAGRIRKHCRRARGIAWERVLELPGVTAEVEGTQARVLVPSSVEDLPPAVAKLQLAGSEPEDPDAREAVPGSGTDVVVSLCPDPFLPLGKAAAAVGHAAQLAWARMDEGRLGQWRAAGFPVAVETPAPARWPTAVAESVLQVVDGGLTVVAPGTITAVARWT